MAFGMSRREARCALDQTIAASGMPSEKAQTLPRPGPPGLASVQSPPSRYYTPSDSS